jgi:dTDP-glucose 4,6-dehydratase
VICADDLSTGRRNNIAAFENHPNFTFLQTDVSTSLRYSGPVDVVAHLASPASPPDYHRLPLETLAVGSRGTENALKLAEEKSARFVLASTSEVYGDPTVHPQTESYWGNVSSTGPRSVYDEAKRFAEAISMAYSRSRGVDVGIVRIFNTFGPRMRAEDGRVVSSFIAQALNGDALTIYGDGEQTRSFCYVDDLVRGIVAMIDSHESGPINLGNPVERTVQELAELVLEITGSDSAIEFHPRPVDDPSRRRPDISLAATRLGWQPQVSTEEGLLHTISYFRSNAAEVSAAAGSIAGAQFEGNHQAGTPMHSPAMARLA